MSFTKVEYKPGDVLTAEQMNAIQQVVDTNEGNIEEHIKANNPHSITPDKIGAAQIVMGSYVGTGLFGKNNPNTLTFEFAPKLIMFLNSDGSISEVGGNHSSTPKQGMIFNPQLLGTNYRKGPPIYYTGSGNHTMSKRSSNGKTIWWYTDVSSANSQYNAENTKYEYIAIG